MFKIAKFNIRVIGIEVGLAHISLLSFNDHTCRWYMILQAGLVVGAITFQT